MNHNQESTLGAMLQNLEKLSGVIARLTNYYPPKPSDNATEINSLVQQIRMAESENSMNSALYGELVAVRQLAFTEMEQRLGLIKSMAEACGLSDKQIEMLARQIAKMRGKKRNKKEVEEETADPKQEPAVTNEETPADLLTDADAAEEKEEEATKEVKPRSVSHRSYGSLATDFQKIVDILRTTAYAPSENDEEFSLEKLQEQATNLTELSKQVDECLAAAEESRKKRNHLLDDAQAMAKRIKAYIKAKYGLRSDEYAKVAKL